MANNSNNCDIILFVPQRQTESWKACFYDAHFSLSNLLCSSRSYHRHHHHGLRLGRRQFHTTRSEAYITLRWWEITWWSYFSLQTIKVRKNQVKDECTDFYRNISIYRAIKMLFGKSFRSRFLFYVVAFFLVDKNIILCPFNRILLLKNHLHVRTTVVEK